MIRLVVLGSPSTYAPPCRECQTPASSHWHGRDISRRAFPEPPLLITAFLAKLLAQEVGGLLEVVCLFSQKSFSIYLLLLFLALLPAHRRRIMPIRFVNTAGTSAQMEGSKKATRLESA